MPVRVSRDQHSLDNSPELIAVFHALQSLLTPRHPPCALSSLTAFIKRSDADSKTDPITPDSSNLFKPTVARSSSPAKRKRRHHDRESNVIDHLLGASRHSVRLESPTYAMRHHKCAKSLGRTNNDARTLMRRYSSIKMPITTNPNCQRTSPHGQPRQLTYPLAANLCHASPSYGRGPNSSLSVAATRRSKNTNEITKRKRVELGPRPPAPMNPPMSFAATSGSFVRATRDMNRLVSTVDRLSVLRRSD
jgi:hypothetical protein